VRAANHDFDEDGVVCDMAALYVDLQVRQRRHQLLVKQADPVPALIVFAPRLVIVSGSMAEGAEDTFKVMLVLKTNVLLNECDTR
jgi:hypothetical protein